MIEAKKSTKTFSKHFFKKVYKLLSPYGIKISTFEKSVSDNFFHLQNMFHNTSRWLKPKSRQKLFRTNFSKFFTSYCPPMGPKFQFLEKVFPTIFFTYKTSFTTFHVDWCQKIDKNFFEPIFQNFLQVIVYLWDQNFNFWKKCFRQFFSLTKHVSQQFTLIEAKKSTKIFSKHFFKKFYKLLSPYGTKILIFVKRNSDKIFLHVIVPLRDQNFNFWKKCFRQFFSLTKHVSQHFTMIEAKKSTKIFSNHFFKKVYKLFSPYGTKISIFEKSVSDNFFHLQNKFHNISRWLMPKNWQQFFRTNSKFFTIYCPPMEPKFQLLKKVFPTIFFTHKMCFTTIHVDWSQKIDKNFFAPFFKKFYKLLSPYGTKISIFEKSVSNNFFHLQNMFHNISRWLKPKNRQKFFRTNSKFFTIYCPPMEPKFQLLKKVFPTIFFTYKTCFTTFHVDWCQKIDNNFFEPIQNFLQFIVPLWNQNFNFWKKCFRQFFSLTKCVSQQFTLIEAKKSTKIFSHHFSKNFTSYCPPMGPKFQFLKKVFPTIFFTYKTCFTTFHVDWSQKIDKNFFEPFFQKSLQVVFPLWDQNFNFWKKCFRQFFSLTKQVSQHFTLIDAKKLTTIFSNQFKIFYNLLSPYGTKISTFEKSVSDNFFHSQNVFHNNSRWLKPKNRQKFFRTIFQKILQVIVPLWDQNFNFWKKCFQQFFSLTKHVSQHFTLIEAKKSTKIFSNQFKIFYNLLSPYGTKISTFEKSVSDNFFHLQNMFHNISRWLKPKNWQKFFRTFFQKILQVVVPLWDQNFNFWKKCFRQFFSLTKHVSQHFTLIEAKKLTKIFSNLFSKNFTSCCPPMGPKFQFLKKVFPTIFFTYKTSFTTFHVDWSQKIDKNFFEPFFKKFYKLLSPYGTKISIFEKSVSDNFFHLQNMFHNISRWLKPKNWQKFFRTFFQKILQFIVPLWNQNFNFWKKCFRQFFSLTKHVSQHFTLIEAKKSTKIFSNQFKIFYNLLSPYGTKISTFEKSVSDNFFHLQNMFHNISRWLKPKNRQKFFRTNSKFFTIYCPPMEPKFQLLKKVFPTFFFTYKTCFTTFHVDWCQKIDKNFFEPIFQNFLQVIIYLWDQNFNFWKKCFRQFFSLTKHVSQQFTLIEAKKSTKIFSKHFFKKFYKLLSPYGTKISIFVKRNSDKIFLHVIVPLWDQNFNFWKKCFRQLFSLTKHVSQHFTMIEAKKSTKIFSNHFFKKVYKLLSPYGTKISTFEKSVSDNFFHLQNKFHNISRWLMPKNWQKFFRTNFSKFFTSYCLPMGPKFQLLKKVFPTIFFAYKTCFTTIHVDWSQKIDKNFFETFFQKILQVIVPLWDQNFNFCKT